MKTEALIAALAADIAPVSPGAVERRLAGAGAVGAVLALALVLAWLGLRPDLAAALGGASFWIKAGYTLTLALGGALMTARLARPAGRVGVGPWLLAAAVLMIGALALIALARTAPDQRQAVWLGHSWSLCPWRIVIVAAPVFIALSWSLRSLAPTRLGLAGAAAGILAGAVGASVYGLACPETSPAFVAVWYSLGIAVCAAAGAALGRWVLRW